MLTTSRVNYLLEYCRGASYATFVAGVHQKESFLRLCYLGIEDLRVYLSLEEGEPALDFFQRIGRVWSRISHVPRSRPLDVQRMLHDSQGFENELAETFFWAYPHAEESYYGSLPMHRDVLSMLNVKPTLSGAKDYRLPCYYDDMVNVDDADGIATVTCEDGHICIPYTRTRSDRVFQMDRALFHADSKTLSLSEAFFDKCFAVKSRLQSLTFSGVMSKIEKLMP